MTNAQMAHKMGLDKFTGYVEDCDSLAKILKTMGFKVEEDDRRVFDAVIIDSCDNTLTVHFGNDMDNLITARIDKINGTYKWYYSKTVKQILAAVRQCMEPYTFPEPETEEEEETMTHTAEEIAHMTEETNRISEQEEQEIADQIEAEEEAKEIMKEEETMKTTKTSTVTLNLNDGTVRFELDGTTYKYNQETKRYSKTVDGKTTRIGKAEYDEAKANHDIAWAAYEQEKLDKEPSRVKIENDLDKPAVLDEFGCVDCRKCNCDKCVHRNCMRRNPKNVGGLGECPRLDNGIMGEGQKIAEEEGIELAEAELEANIRNERKKPARKPRKSKDIAYEGNGVTLTAKQVDFLLDLKQTNQWDGFDTMFWTDVICDEIEGQFAGKPMTVGAMVSTLCEKGLGYRATDSLTDMATGRSRKATYFALTELGQEIAKELGLE